LIIRFANGSGANAAGIKLQTANASASYTDRFVINTDSATPDIYMQTNGGGVGIGTTSFGTFKLSVAGTTNLNGVVTFGTGSGTYSFPNTRGSANQVLKTNGTGTVTWQADTDTNTNYYLDGITKSSTTLTFSVSGGTDVVYTGFGSNAFNSTAFTTNTGTVTSVSGGNGIDSSGGTTPSIALNLGELTNTAIVVANDYIPFIDGSATGTSKKDKFSDVIALIAGTNLSATNGVLAATDTVYSHPSAAGDDISIDTGALTGATVISDLDFNITTNTLGHVTDANGSISTRTLTLANLGYTGATNANYSVGNATHTGEVTGSTSLTIAGNVVDEANLKVSNAPTDGYVLTARSAAVGDMTWEAASGGGSSTILDMDKYLHVGMREDSGSSGNDGGTLTSNSWTTRNLNHTWAHNGSISSWINTTNNTVTLAAGTYYVKFWAIGFGVEEHQAHLWDGATVLVHGSNGRSTSSYTSSATANQSVGAGIISWSSGTKSVSIRHIVDRTRADYGGGMEITQGYNSTISSSNVPYNTYWGLEIWKIS
jgi:hypothetical protein